MGTGQFEGFPAGRQRFTSIPDLFFSRVLPAIDDLAELKVTLHVLWRVHRKRGYPRYVSRSELLSDGDFMAGLGDAQALQRGLDAAVARGTLLRLDIQRDDRRDEWYFVNNQEGRRAVAQARSGELDVPLAPGLPPEPPPAERPNIFALYEQTIGVLSPIIADELRDAEETYPADWIADAFKEAARHNVRKWSYVRAILERWLREGRPDEATQRGDKADRRRYIEGEYARYVGEG